VGFFFFPLTTSPNIPLTNTYKLKTKEERKEEKKLPMTGKAMQYD
jgi:hypothetical protein